MLVVQSGHPLFPTVQLGSASGGQGLPPGPRRPSHDGFERTALRRQERMTASTDRYAAWQRPTPLCRCLLVGLALALPGGLFGALLGLITGAFTLAILAGGLLAAVAGATLEARSSAPPLSPSRRSESNTNNR